MPGRAPGGYDANAYRQAFNTRRQYYQDTSDLSDTTARESSGAGNGIEYDNQRIEVLNASLTDDGGYLNPAGRQLVGSALAHHLARFEPATGLAPTGL